MLLLELFESGSVLGVPLRKHQLHLFVQLLRCMRVRLQALACLGLPGVRARLLPDMRSRQSMLHLVFLRLEMLS